MFKFSKIISKKNVPNPFFIWLFIVFFISVFFRFWNYSNRWGFAYDQAQFATVARYALETLQLPLLGPFSSGGPFQTGGEWYWLVMMGTVISPNFILSPWIFNSLLTIVAVWVMVLAGKTYKDKLFGIILGLIISVSPAQIHQSTNLTNQTPIVLFSALALLFVFLYIREKKGLYIFIAALAVGIGTTIHIQSVALVPFLFFTLLLYPERIVRNALFVIAGLSIPWIPVLISDMQNNFYNTIQMLTYFSNDQAKTSYDALGKRWLTFITIFIPSAWGQIIGGNIVAGYAVIISAGALFVYSFLKKILTREVFLIVISLAAMFTIMRYIRTPLFESFYVFIHPFVIFITGWVIYFIFNKNKFLGAIIISILLISSVISFWKPINDSINHTLLRVEELKEILYEKYPDESFSIYDYESNNSSISLPLSYILYMEKRSDKNGVKIGLYRETDDSSFNFNINSFYGEFKNLRLYEVSASESGRLIELGWDNQDPKTVYDRTQFWFKDYAK